MKIIVDMDEVLCQFVEKVLFRWNRDNNTKFKRSDIDMWRMEQCLGKDLFGKPAEGLIDNWLAEDGFFDDLAPMPGAIEGFNLLRADGHDVVIATSIPEVAVHAYDGKRRWVREHFPDFSMKNFFAVSRKGWLDGDVLIDDGSHNLRDWTSCGRLGGILVDAPWNHDIGPTCNGVPLERVHDWSEITLVVEEIARQKHLERMRAEHGVIL